MEEFSGIRGNVIQRKPWIAPMFTIFRGFMNVSTNCICLQVLKNHNRYIRMSWSWTLAICNAGFTILSCPQFSAIWGAAASSSVFLCVCVNQLVKDRLAMFFSHFDVTGVPLISPFVLRISTAMKILYNILFWPKLELEYVLLVVGAWIDRN